MRLFPVLCGITLLVSTPPLLAQSSRRFPPRSRAVVPPSAPTDLRATALSPSQITLSWSRTDVVGLRVQIQRRSTPTGPFGVIATLPRGASSYEDSGLSPSNTYHYRLRIEGSFGSFAFSNEAQATALAPPPSAPANLQAVALSTTQINLTWTNPATPFLRVHIERISGIARIYAEIATVPAGTVTYGDSGLNPSTNYIYRIRAESTAGFSPYSSESNAITLAALPTAPTNLQATTVSQTEILLSWVNTATNARAVRVEMRVDPTGPFQELLGPTFPPNTNQLRVTELFGSTTYTFRVRAEGEAGLSGYSNQVTVTTLPKLTIFLIHGLRQGYEDMEPLARSLTLQPVGIDNRRFQVDARFDFSQCAYNAFCDSNCNISAGAQRLAQYILNANPSSEIMLIGYSLGGLIARDMIAYNRLGVLNRHQVVALITLGTPNAGYPFASGDDIFSCTPLVKQMEGDWRSQQATNSVRLAPYLVSLTDQWASTSYPGESAAWLAAAGRSCSNPARPPTSTGCRDISPYSDGVVCYDSATFNLNVPPETAPNLFWNDPEGIYVHTSGGIGRFLGVTILCPILPDSPNNPTLFDPPTSGSLFITLRTLINAYHE